MGYWVSSKDTQSWRLKIPPGGREGGGGTHLSPEGGEPADGWVDGWSGPARGGTTDSYPWLRLRARPQRRSVAEKLAGAWELCPAGSP